MYAKCFYPQPGGSHFTFEAFGMMKALCWGGGGDLKTNTNLERVNTPRSLASSLRFPAKPATFSDICIEPVTSQSFTVKGLTGITAGKRGRT